LHLFRFCPNALLSCNGLRSQGVLVDWPPSTGASPRSTTLPALENLVCDGGPLLRNQVGLNNSRLFVAEPSLTGRMYHVEL
jgi:hypothetical protein